MVMLVLAAIALLLWAGVLLAPWAAWLPREHLEPAAHTLPSADDFTILIPARNEAATLATTLAALRATVPTVPVIVIDDESTDGTANLARASGLPHVAVIDGTPPPVGWTGKLWALQQGLARTTTRRVLLLDADIRLAPGMLSALQHRADHGYELVSVCAEPNWDTLASRWLLPAFVYFFKLLYPFALANRVGTRTAAAAGGVVLVDHAALIAAGGFSQWQGAIIDDCALAAHMKRAGYRCWIGLSHGACSLRRMSFRDAARMIARTAFVQLRESLVLTACASALLVLAFWIPVCALAFGSGAATRMLGLVACLLLLGAYLPTLLYYRRSPLTGLLLPATATFFLVAMWYSAWRALAGTRSVWKGRRYPHGSM